MKAYARVIGIDDGFFRRSQKKVPIFGVVMRGNVVESILFREITVDGTDATDAILSMLETEVGKQVRLVFLNGAAMGGTNVVDPDRLPVPYVAVVRKKPTPSFFDALRHSPFAGEKLKVAKKYSWKYVDTPKGGLWISSNTDEALKYLVRYQITGAFPEPLRLAHLCATALTLGESRGHA